MEARASDLGTIRGRPYSAVPYSVRNGDARHDYDPVVVVTGKLPGLPASHWGFVLGSASPCP